MAALLPKALGLYHMALALALEGPPEEAGHLIRLALANNIGQIYYENADYGIARHFFGSLRLMLAEGFFIVEDPAMKTGFLFNIMVVDMPHLAAAA